MKKFILNCYFVFYYLHLKMAGLTKSNPSYEPALMLLTIPIFTGTLFFVAIVYDAFNMSFGISSVTMIVLGFLFYWLLKNLIFKVYKVDKQEDGTHLNISISKGAVTQAVVLYVVAFGLMLIRTQFRYGYLFKR